VRTSMHDAAEDGFGDDIVGTSASMRRLLSTVARFVPTDMTITLMGETGTGKDLLARAVHDRSARANGPFVVLDCGAIPSGLVESELMGHERGAFTGAVNTYAGAFERAHGGTLFLNEIGELPLDLQSRLLRALESRRVRRVGGALDRTLDLRIVAATNRDLVSEVAAGRFRSDLYFRLAVALVRVPPLRERLDDLPLLVSRLLADMGCQNVAISDESYALLREHSWPGNIRELRNTLSYAVAFIEHGVIEPQHLHLTPASQDGSGVGQLRLAGLSLDRIERVAITQTLAQFGGNKVLAARSLGIALSTLYEKLRRYNIELGSET
jgi:transcriptional regulator with PAS, ATPase and Fis domain